MVLRFWHFACVLRPSVCWLVFVFTTFRFFGAFIDPKLNQSFLHEIFAVKFPFKKTRFLYWNCSILDWSRPGGLFQGVSYFSQGLQWRRVPRTKWCGQCSYHKSSTNCFQPSVIVDRLARRAKGLHTLIYFLAHAIFQKKQCSQWKFETSQN